MFCSFIQAAYLKSRASFQLPPTDCITISSNATSNSITSDQLNGTLSVSMNNNPKESSILFTVEMQSSRKDIQDQTTICFSSGGVNKGLSIFVIHNLYSFDYDVDSDRRFRAILMAVP